jgi:Family of unknown function (DUF6186)
VTTRVDARTIGLVVWSGLAVATLAAELLGRFVIRRLPTTGDVLGTLARSALLRWILLLGWFWLGWHLFVRRGAA